MPAFMTATTQDSRRGVTLLELMFVVAIFTVISGMLFGLATGIGDTAQTQRIRATANDDARKAMLYIARQVRQASMGTLSAMPASNLTFRVAADMDGNGSAVDVGGGLEVGTPITIRRDAFDMNHDGLATQQLVMVQDGNFFVLANNVIADEDLNHNNVLETAEDLNGNGRLDRGVWFEQAGGAIRVIIQTHGIDRRDRDSVITLTQTVAPRN